MHLVTTEQMRSLEQAAVAAGATWAGLMEHAGWGVAQETLHYLGGVQDQRIVVLVGPGNNGGDGLVAARHLHDAGARVSLYIWERSPTTPDANWQRCRERDLLQVQASDDTGYQRLHELLTQANLVIDALLGMGISRMVGGALSEIVAAVNARPAACRVLAIDMPTGVHSDTGAVMGSALRATMTVATGLPKRGLLLYPGRSLAGKIVVADIGISSADLETIMSETLTGTWARTLLPARPEDSHKGTFGKLLVVAGSLHYPGAALLATTAAGRVGAGLVTQASGRTVLLAGGRSPEVTLLPLLEAEPGTLGAEAATVVFEHLEGYTALLVGCGLGREDATGRFMQRLLGLEQPRTRARVGFRVERSQAEPSPEAQQAHAQMPPTVIDADGLNLLAGIENWSAQLPNMRCILTPHPGEMKRLLGVEELDADRVQVAVDAAQHWQQVVVLKGATTVVAAPDGRSRVYAAGNPALATAGTGDVLAGAIAGLLAQGLQLFDAAALGVYLLGAAGALVRAELGDAGALAGDLLPRLPLAIKQLKNG